PPDLPIDPADLQSRGSGAMVRRCRSGMRPDQPIPPFDPTPVTVTKPGGGLHELFRGPFTLCSGNVRLGLSFRNLIAVVQHGTVQDTLIDYKSSDLLNKSSGFGRNRGHSEHVRARCNVIWNLVQRGQILSESIGRRFIQAGSSLACAAASSFCAALLS